MIRTVPVHFVWGLHTQMSIRMSDAHLLAIGPIVPSESFAQGSLFHLDSLTNSSTPVAIACARRRW